MTKMRSSCIGLVRHEEVKQDRIRKTCNLICERADIQQKGDQVNSLKYMDIKSNLQGVFNSKVSLLKNII